MARITLEYDARNTIAKKFIDLIYSIGVFKVKIENEDSPYDKEFVEKIKRGEKSKSWTAIKTEDLWK